MFRTSSQIHSVAYNSASILQCMKTYQQSVKELVTKAEIRRKCLFSFGQIQIAGKNLQELKKVTFHDRKRVGNY